MSDPQTGNNAGVATRQPPKLRGWRRVGFPVAAMLLGLTPFVVLEVVLTLADVGKPTRYDDPFVGFSSIHPLFELDADKGLYVTSLSRQLYFGKQQFAARKPKNGFRVFCLGGSTVRGRPHETDTAFSKWLEIELNGRDSTRTYEVVNCGGVSYASYRLLPVLDEVLGYDPDLIVLATGHNEFLEDRTYQALKSRSQAESWFVDRVFSLRSATLARQWMNGSETGERTILSADVKARLDEASGYASYHRNDEWWQDICNHYRTTVRSMVSKCQAMKIPVMLINLGCNLRDCPPFKSEHRPRLTHEEKTKWQTAFDLATKQQAAAQRNSAKWEARLKSALASYQEAEAIDGEHALLLFRIARCYDRLEQYEQARAYYIKAKEWDVCPLRMKNELNEVLYNIGKELKVSSVDIRRRIEKRCADQIPGFDWYVDHVHLTIGGHQFTAQAIVNEMNKQGIRSIPVNWIASRRRAAYSDHINQLPPTYLAKSKQRIQWVENWAQRQRLSDETIPVDAAGWLRYGHRHLEIGRTDDAWTAYQTALSGRPSLKRDLLLHTRKLVEQGRAAVAEPILKHLSVSNE